MPREVVEVLGVHWERDGDCYKCVSLQFMPAVERFVWFLLDEVWTMLALV